MSLSKMIKMGPSLNRDIISDMPLNITENILSRLPLREAVRTCILSKKWRYKWVTLPELVFNSSSLGDGLVSQRDKLVKFIDGVLSLHRGPICKFELSRLYIPNPTDLDKWILWVSMNGTQELIIHREEYYRPYIVSSYLYSCEHLNHLELSHCRLLRPPLFASFKSLKSLKLYEVECVGFTIENMISRCPKLENLEIDRFKAYMDMIIYGPKLKKLVVNGLCQASQKICFKNIPLLTSVSLNLLCYAFDPSIWVPEVGDRFKVLKGIFGCLVGVEELAVRGNILKVLAQDTSEPNKLPNGYYHMKRLHLEICFNDFSMVSMALCLIRSAPILQELKIDEAVSRTVSRTNSTVTEFSGIQDEPKLSLNQLRNVTISCFPGKPQLELAKFLLTITPALEKMSIHGLIDTKSKCPTLSGSWMLEELIPFAGGFSKAKIEYFEPRKLVEVRKRRGKGRSN